MALVVAACTAAPSPPCVPLTELVDHKPVAFVVAFTDDTPAAQRRVGHLRPGGANKTLARWVREHAHLCQVVFTQESVLWAVWHPDEDFDPATHTPPADGAAIDGTPVYRLHGHDPNVTVHTLEG